LLRRTVSMAGIAQELTASIPGRHLRDNDNPDPALSSFASISSRRHATSERRKSGSPAWFLICLLNVSIRMFNSCPRSFMRSFSFLLS
jgi:hypothetical protein